MVGGRGNKPASKSVVLFAGVFITAISGLLTLAVAFGEPVPGAPAWAMPLAILIPLSGLLTGLYLICTGLRMP